MKWIDTKEGLLMTLKHGIDISQEYQRYLDNDEDAFIQPDDEGEDLMDFEIWFECFEEQLEWENSDDFWNLINRGN